MNTSSFSAFRGDVEAADAARRARLERTADTAIRRDLLRDGIAIVRGALHPRHYELLRQFQAITEQVLGGTPDCGGYIDMHAQSVRGGLQIMGARLNRVTPNHGQVRLQTKGLSFPMPGFADAADAPLLRDTFSWWHGDDGEITRGTIEWIVPAELNHNGWHKDTVRPQLKAFILLGDVDDDTAPMYYARGSHLCRTDFEAEVARRLTAHGTAADLSISRRGLHYPAVVGANPGYLSDDEAPNAPSQIDWDEVTLGDTAYEKSVCTGAVGDVVFFDSCGFHSGNRSNGKTRRTITLSSPSNGSELGTALTAAGHPRV